MPLSPSAVKIIQATDATDELFQACQVLISQLSINNPHLLTMFVLVAF
jgi:hypothetical protein